MLIRFNTPMNPQASPVSNSGKPATGQGEQIRHIPSHHGIRVDDREPRVRAVRREDASTGDPALNGRRKLPIMLLLQLWLIEEQQLDVLSSTPEPPGRHAVKRI